MTNEQHIGWRKKDVHRFNNPALVAACHEDLLGRDVFLYHEAICDLIELERTNSIKVSLFTLARTVHDSPDGDAIEWAESRQKVLESLRKHDLILFDGDAHLHREIQISLPDATYVKWHDRAAGKKARATKAAEQPRKGGRFAAAKTPQAQDNTPQAPHAGLTGTATVPQPPQAPLDIDIDVEEDIEEEQATRETVAPGSTGTAPRQAPFSDDPLDATLTDLADVFDCGTETIRLQFEAFTIKNRQCDQSDFRTAVSEWLAKTDPERAAIAAPFAYYLGMTKRASLRRRNTTLAQPVVRRVGPTFEEACAAEGVAL